MNRLHLLTALVALLLLGCSKKDEQPSQTIQEIQKIDGIPVTVLTMKKTALLKTEKISGTLEGIAQTYIANPVGGTLDKIFVKVGDEVKKDQLLAHMTFSTGSATMAAQSGYDYAAQAYKRAEQLHKEGAVSQEQLEGARAQYENALRGLKQTKALENITTPIAGTILEVMQVAGSNIDDKTPIMKVADTKSMKSDLQVNEGTIHLLKKDQKAFLILGDDTLWGTVSAVALSAYDLTHSFRVSTQFDNQKKLLSPGMYKEIEIVVDQKEGVFSLPIEYVNYENDGTPWVYIIKNAKSLKSPVVIGLRTGTHYEIVSGITEGDHVVASGATLLKNGSTVKVMK